VHTGAQWELSALFSFGEGHLIIVEKKKERPVGLPSKNHIKKKGNFAAF
jgi:hypothetical protein